MASDDSSTCSSANFSTNGISYQRVYGRARGYQKGDTLAFYGSQPSINRIIDEDYVSGLSIAYSSNPRQHIWTFATGHGERDSSQFNCPCSVNGSYSPSSFVLVTTIIVNQLLGIMLTHIFLMTHYGTEQDV